jgi:hypothetical protein
LISNNNVGFKGRKHSEETKIKMSHSRKGLGKPHTEETKRKLSEITKHRKFIQRQESSCQPTNNGSLLITPQATSKAKK